MRNVQQWYSIFYGRDNKEKDLGLQVDSGDWRERKDWERYVE